MSATTHDLSPWERVALNTANDRFKARYGTYLRWAILVSIVVYLLVFSFSPVLEITPYRLKEESIQVVDIPTSVDIPPPPKELPKPQVPIEAAPDAEVEEDIDIAPTLPDDFTYVPPAMSGGGSAGNDFVAFDTKPEITHFERPVYTEFAREAGLEGMVVVDVLVGTDGRVKAARVSRPIHPVLDNSALAAAQKCRFTPGKQRNIPVEVWVSLPYNFTLF